LRGVPRIVTQKVPGCAAQIGHAKPSDWSAFFIYDSLFYRRYLDFDVSLQPNK
jgi:hypothetical protein